MLKYVTPEELLKLFDPEVWDKLRDAAKRTYASHIVVAENLQMDAGRFGWRTALCVGHACTYKRPEDCEGKWLGDTPSERQYFTCYTEVPEAWRMKLDQEIT